jgi:hypothetical protein
MNRTLLHAAIVAAFSLCLVPTADAAAPAAATEAVACSCDNAGGFISCDDPSQKEDNELARRFAERVAGKAGLAIGASLGGAAGLVIGGPAMAAAGAAVGGFIGEVIAEYLTSRLFRAQPSPYPPTRP